MAVHLKISANGRVCIPADVRARLGLKDGDTLLLQETDEGLMLSTIEQSVRRAQAIVRKMMEGKPNFTVDDFLREKREETRFQEERDRKLYGG
jgi:AbrB family looped-hinge helix DNA binding protein